MFEKEPEIEKRILNAFDRLNKILPKNIGTNAGSTALILLRNENIIYVANVGDSRAIVNNGDKAVAITVDHKPDVEKEKLRIINDGGFVFYDPMGTPRVNGTLAMSRAVGDFYLQPYVSWVPDIFTVKLWKKNHFLVAASDGLWDVLSNQEVVDIVNKSLKENDISTNPKTIMSKVTHSLLKEARLRGSGDNTTILLLIL
jgi:serine/threonine protein phosphatase PrpC